MKLPIFKTKLTLHNPHEDRHYRLSGDVINNNDDISDPTYHTANLKKEVHND